jgi:CRISPR-associated protein Csb2
MPFAILADLPLGTYRGAGADGRPERIPSVARLHSALLCAAGFGPRAVEHGNDELELDDADGAALRWLEENPPDSVHLPELLINVGRVTAYRDDGTLKKSKDAISIKKLPKSPDAGTAVDGQFAWIWRETPPEPVRAALEQLCPDVAYLGTTEAPVRLIAVTGEDFSATHDLEAGAGLFTPGGAGIERPAPGRLAELSEAHRAATGKPPKASSDNWKTDEKSLSPVPGRKATETAWYAPRAAEPAQVPWPEAIVIPTDAAVPEQERVAWAVAVHRRLIQLIGFGAPPMITGAYPEGVRRPANRVALHFLDDRMPARQRLNGLVILVPEGADTADLDALRRAAAELTSVRGPGGRIRKLDVNRLQVVAGNNFWEAPAPGAIRLWHTAPPAVPDTRGSRDDEWNFAHAALLSVGFAWKDRLPKSPGRGAAYYRGLAAGASEAGVTVVHAKAIRTTHIGRYVHKINEHAVVRPYTATLSMGDLTGASTIQAIGQTRHLGGGLLVPFDVPEGTRVSDVFLPRESGERS